MGINHSARRYDVFDAGKMANPDARMQMETSDEGIDFVWFWNDKQHKLFISEKDLTDEFILFRLFESAIEMARE